MGSNSIRDLGFFSSFASSLNYEFHIMYSKINRLLQKQNLMKAFPGKLKKLNDPCTSHSSLLLCYEPLQKLRVRLGSCKTGLIPPVTLCY